jgi:hypothetical protein
MTLNNSVGQIIPTHLSPGINNLLSQTPANLNGSAFFSMGDDSVNLGPSSSNVNSYNLTG